MSDGLILSTPADDAALADAAQNLSYALPDPGEPGSLRERDENTVNTETAAYIYAAARREGLTEKHSQWVCGYAGAEGLAREQWRAIVAKATKITDPWHWLDAHAGGEVADELKAILSGYESTGVTEATPAAIDLSGPPKEPDWVIEGDAASGRITAVSGDQSATKTTMLLKRAQAVARGEDFLARPTKQGRVLFITGEEPAEQIQDEKLKPLGFSADDLEHIDFFTRGTFPLLGTPDGNRWLTAQARSADYALICIDTTSSAVGGINGNDNEQVNALFNDVLEPLVDATGAGLIFNHHERKSGGSGDRSQAALGARAWTNRPSYHLTLATFSAYDEKPTGEGERVITWRKFVERRPKVRGGGVDEKFIYELAGEKDRPNGATLRLEPRLPRMELTNAEQIAAACNGDMTRVGLAEAVGWNKTGDRFVNALNAALDQKLIRKVGNSYVPGEATV